MPQLWKRYKTRILMMKNKDIKNLADLRKAKRELKFKIDRIENQSSNSFLENSTKTLINSIESSLLTNKSPIGTQVHSTLNFLSNSAQKKFNIGNTGKKIISIAILITAPIIAKKIQNYIEDKF